MNIRKTMLVAGLLLITAGLFAHQGFALLGTFNLPVDNEEMDPSVYLGAQYGFWGVFTASAGMYTEFVYGEDSFLKLKEINPLGVFSWGLGMQIPMGNFYLTLGWDEYYHKPESSTIRKYCNSFRIGFYAKLTESFALSVQNRTYRDFDASSGIKADNKNSLGIGAMLFL